MAMIIFLLECLKTCNSAIAEPLSILFNNCMNQSMQGITQKIWEDDVSKEFEKRNYALTLLMYKAYSQCSWVWDPWGSVTKDQQIAITDIPHMRNKFKQNRTSENWYKYKTLRSKCANLLKKTKKRLLC